VKVRIGANGEVLCASPARFTGMSVNASSCIAARVSAAQFSPPEAGSGALEIPVSVRVTP
jgi:hypothetical protein